MLVLILVSCTKRLPDGAQAEETLEFVAVSSLVANPE